MTVFSSIPPRYLENIHAEQSTFTVKAINLKIHLHNGSFSSASAQHRPQSLFGGGGKIGLNLAEHLRPGLYRVGGVGCRDALRAPEGFRRRIFCPGPAVRLAFFVELLTEIPDDQIAAHLQVGHGAFEVFLPALAESGPLFQFTGEQCVCIGELIHDLLLAGGGETIVPPTVKIVAIPPPVGKIREPGFGDEARLLAEEFAVGHPATAGNQLPPLPGITGGIPAPPVSRTGALFRRKAVDAVAEQRQKSHLVDPVHQILPAVDAGRVLPGRSPHDPFPVFHCHPAVPLSVSGKNSITQKAPGDSLGILTRWEREGESPIR